MTQQTLQRPFSNLPVRFGTERYRASHGKNPRGRGSWAFSFSVKIGAFEWEERAEWLRFSPAMTYTEARTWARLQASELARRLYDEEGVTVTAADLWVEP